MKEIALDKLCLTASSLNAVFKDIDDDRKYDDTLYEQSLGIIRRMYGIKGISNNAMDHGKKYEKALIANRYIDTRFTVQQACSTDIVINGISIPIRATLDVFDYHQKNIIEIKCPYFIKVNEFGKDEYAKKYYTQIQIQYLCSRDTLKAENANIVIFSNNELFTSSSIAFDPDFVSNNEVKFLEFWTFLNNVYEKYISGDNQVMIDVHKYDGYYYKILEDGSFMQDLEQYAELTKKIASLEEERDLVRKYIERKLENENITNFPTPIMTIKMVEGSERTNYSKIVKDLIDTSVFSEEQRQKYTTKGANSWRFISKKPKEALL